jgi:hypothetical protein
MAACTNCYYPITEKAVLFESDYTCPNCEQRLVPKKSSVLLSILLLLGVPSVTTGIVALVLGIDSLATMIGSFVLLPFGIYTGGTVIRYEPSPGVPAIDLTTSPESYTWTFPGCPIQIRIRLEIVHVLQRLVELAQAPGTLAAYAGGLLLGDTASPGVTRVAGIEPMAGLEAAAVEAAIGKAEYEVVGFFRVLSGGTAQPGASLRITDDDVTLAAGFFNQPSSVVLLIETVETAAAKATFFFWDGGKMLGDFSLLDFPLDAHLLAALERQGADSWAPAPVARR